jgi:hypothetical protein
MYHNNVTNNLQPAKSYSAGNSHQKTASVVPPEKASRPITCNQPKTTVNVTHTKNLLV